MNKKKTALIIGAGISGLSAARFLHSQGWKIAVYDDRDTPELRKTLRELKSSGASFYLNELEKVSLIHPQLAVLSPGVRSDHPLVKSLINKEIELIGELELGFRNLTGQIVAITGTNGKSTSTAWLGSIFRQTGRSHFTCGNLGLPITEIAGQTKSDSLISVETSSFQLMSISTFHPQIVILHALTPDHTEWHGGFEQYTEAKSRIWMNQTAEDWLIYNIDDPVSAKLVKSAHSRLFPFSVTRTLDFGAFGEGKFLVIRGQDDELKLSLDLVRIPGIHNVMNALSVAAAGFLLNLDSDSIKEGLASFKGLPHRLELVRYLNQVRYYNDSKATNPDSGRWALMAMDRPTVLIAGGRGKGDDYSSLRSLVKQKVKFLLLIGEETPNLARDLGDLVPYTVCSDLEAAVTEASQLANPGEAVLLSPLATSFDQFKNFEDRGLHFRKFVAGLVE